VKNARLSLVRGPKLKRSLPRPVSEGAARNLMPKRPLRAPMNGTAHAMRRCSRCSMPPGFGSARLWLSRAPICLCRRCCASTARAARSASCRCSRKRERPSRAMSNCALTHRRRRAALPREPRRSLLSAHGSSADGAFAHESWPAFERDSARFAARIRDASARERRRSSSDPRPARTRIAFDDSDLHERRSAKNFAGVSARASACVIIFVRAHHAARLCFQGSQSFLAVIAKRKIERAEKFARDLRKLLANQIAAKKSSESQTTPVQPRPTQVKMRK
jgi:hypothetical protein